MTHRHFYPKSAKRLFDVYSDWNFSEFKQFDQEEAVSLFRYLRAASENDNLAGFFLHFTDEQVKILRACLDDMGHGMTENEARVYEAIQGDCRRRSDLVELLDLDDEEVDQIVDSLIADKWISIDCDGDINGYFGETLDAEVIGGLP